MNCWVGTSGFSYKAWRGSFYPEDLPNDGMLAYYGERLNAVEINNTFYRMPARKVSPPKAPPLVDVQQLMFAIVTKK